MSDPTKVVDYDAWSRGYMPPAEHLLIDALAFRGARVVASSSLVKGAGWWIVVQGEPFGWEEEYEMMMFATERQLKYARQRREAAVGLMLAVRSMIENAPLPQPPEESK